MRRRRQRLLPQEGPRWGRVFPQERRSLHFHFLLSCIGEGNSNPRQCSCLEIARDGGAWWAAVYGVTPSRTWLTWLSSSSTLEDTLPALGELLDRWRTHTHTHTRTHAHTCLLFLAVEHQTLWFPGQSWKGLAKVPDSFQEKRTGRRGGVQPLWESFGFGYQQTAWASAPGSLLCCLTTVITLAVFRGLSKTAKLVCVYIFTEASCSSLHTGPSKCTSTHLHVGVTECGNSCLPKCAHTSVCRCTWWGSPFSNTWSVSLPDFSIQQCGDINTVGRTLNWVLPLPCFAKSWRVYPNIRNHPSARSALSPCRTLVCYTRGFPEVLSMSALCSFHWTSVHLVIYSSNSHWASAGPDPVLKVRNTKTSISWPLSSWKAHSSQGERRGHNLSCSKADPGETMAEKEVTTTHICGI